MRYCKPQLCSPQKRATMPNFIKKVYDFGFDFLPPNTICSHTIPQFHCVNYRFIKWLFVCLLQGRSTESAESNGSAQIHVAGDLHAGAMAGAASADMLLHSHHHTRVGSFRGRLKKQQPISMPEPPGSVCTSRQVSCPPWTWSCQ